MAVAELIKRSRTFSPGLAGATKSDIRDLQTEIAGELRTLAARQDSLMTLLRTEAMSTQDTLRNQSEQIFDFRGGITTQLNAIARSLTTLEALVGENQRGIAGVRDQLANLRRVQFRLAHREQRSAPRTVHD